jgi:hypothetical protein|tara:strand:- start:17762 stop:18619 length:858 start_codon:yes stop_codon:yes gene_type:complete
MSKKTLKIVNAYRDAAIKYRGFGTNSYVIFNAEGKPREFLGEACYGALSYGRGYHDDPVYFLDYPSYYGRMANTPTRELRAFSKWLIEKSPWSPLFVDTTEDTINPRGVLMEVKDWPTRYIIQAGILFRHLIEYPKVPTSWYHIQKLIHPTAAFVLAYYLTGRPNDFYVEKAENGYQNMALGHGAWSFDISRPGLDRLMQINQELFKGMTQFREDVSAYKGMSKLWEKGDYNNPEGKKLQIPKDTGRSKLILTTLGTYVDVISGDSKDKFESIVYQFAKENGVIK